MAEIHVLDKNTINQIAAGEVVERPASIVKELVENAVDAKSSAITIEIKGGGIDFIRITDNGSGIEKDQVATAFLRHATSKISTAKDLETVASLGFRGEALSSIAAVSKVELITKTDLELAGIRYVMEGGEEISCEEIGCPEGTTFIVRDLFYNTPARRKFLKSKMSEAGYVEAFVQRLAISHPEISFRFIHDNKNKIATSGNGNLKDVIYHIYGKESAQNMMEVHGECENIKISGFVGKPSVSRGNRNYENYFVNGRYLRNPILSKAIEDAYKGHTMVHKFPFCVLMLWVEPHLVDVNVHPAKMEMRFGNGDELYTFVMTAVKNALEKKAFIPNVSIGKEEKKQRARDFLKSKESQHMMDSLKNRESQPMVNSLKNKESQSMTDAPQKREPFEKRKKEVEAHFENLPKEKITAILEKKEEEPEKNTACEEVGNTPVDQPRSSLLKEKLHRFNVGELAETKKEIDAIITGSYAEDRKEEDSVKENFVKEITDYAVKEENSQVSMENLVQNDKAESLHDSDGYTTGVQLHLKDMEIPLLSKEARPKHRVIGQLFKTYWLVEYENKLFFVDQHAAHEKVMYERMKKNLEEKRIDQQMVAPPIILNLSIREQEAFKKCQKAFEQLGYQVEEFGSDSYAIRAVPANLYGIDQQDLFIDILDQVNDNFTKMDLTMITDKLASMSCKAAVKGNQNLSMKEMDALMDQLLELEDPYQCPHGRPTIISMTKYEIEKKFSR